MEVRLESISRKFNRQKVFQDITYTFQNGGSHAILGGNGSGKSTLIRVILGALSPSAGHIVYAEDDEVLSREKAPFRISIAAPYFELIEELTAMEFLKFHLKFRGFISAFTPLSLLTVARLEDSKDKEIRNFSSGMKQRLRLALAVCSDVSLILLDEPTSNLDPEGIEWYKSLIHDYAMNKTLIIGSNFSKDEIGFCTHQLELKNYK
ncbi:MAG: ABC transporter ATP-binding protein [Owenweeksia sp.]